MIELSRYYFEVLRKDDAFVLYRGRNGENASQVLVLSPAGERPSPENLQRLEREYSLGEALNTEWAIRPLAIGSHSDRPVLISHDPGAALLDQLLPEQTERMNRSIDSRSDLYAFGVILTKCSPVRSPSPLPIRWSGQNTRMTFQRNLGPF